jgi:hypothetical protein
LSSRLIIKKGMDVLGGLPPYPASRAVEHVHRRTRTTPADVHGTCGRARHWQMCTASADAHGTGGRAQHANLRAPAQAHGARGRGKVSE